MRARVVDGRTVLLDLVAGTYVVFDAVATVMWDALLTLSPEERVAVLAARFDAPADKLTGDLAAFEHACVERGFLARQPRDAPQPRPTLATAPQRGWTLRAWRSLAATTLALRRSGFPEVYRRYQRLPKPAERALDEHALQRAERAFLRAENFFALKSAPKDCLPRSLALYRFLLSVGLAAEHRVGVQRYHFEAHAWVACGGRPVLDKPQFVARYTDLATM